MQPSGCQTNVLSSGAPPKEGSPVPLPSQPSYRALALRGSGEHTLLMAEEDPQLAAWSRLRSDQIFPAS